MDTITNTKTDLIAQKTAEYENIPGLVLGLDGWILRSLPKHLRAQFLNGYEKLLRIVFHPDRYTDPVKKESRQSYLQSVSDAVRYMLADEFAFETTVESVPTRKNPLLTLREAIDVRDKIIGRLDDQLKDKTSDSSDYREKAESLQTRLMDCTAEMERRTSMDYRLRQIVNSCVKKFPVPLGLKFSAVKGYEIEFTPEAPLTKAIGYYSSASELSYDHEWIAADSWMAVARDQALLAARKSFRLQKRKVTGEPGVSVAGAMSIAHLCQFIARENGYPADKLSPEKTFATIQTIYQEVSGDEEEEHYRRWLGPFLLPFYSTGMILLLAHRTPGMVKHSLFVVDSVDAGDGPLQAVNDGLERERQELTRKTLELSAKLQASRSKSSNLQSRMKRLLKSNKKLRKQLEKTLD